MSKSDLREMNYPLPPWMEADSARTRPPPPPAPDPASLDIAANTLRHAEQAAGYPDLLPVDAWRAQVEATDDWPAK